MVTLMRMLLREASASPAAPPAGAAGDRDSAVYGAIAELAAPERAALVAVDVAGLSYREAARVLRASQGMVAARVFRARDEIAVRLEQSH